MKIHILFLLLPPIVILPHLLKNYMSATSTALGLMASLLFVLVAWMINNGKFVLRNNALIYMLILVSWILLGGAFSFKIYSNFNNEKYYLSVIILLIFLFSANIIAYYSSRISSIKIEKVITVVFYCILLDGVLATIKLYFNVENLFFITTEASHFALILLPFLCFKVLNEDKIFKIAIWIALTLFIIFYIQNLTLLVGLILIGLIKSFKTTTILLIFFLIFVTSIPSLIDLDYFLSRLNLWETDNLSGLVFISGWERAYINFIDSHAIGIGFQQLGFTSELGTYQKIVAAKSNIGLNLQDGGSTASKLISELGIIGLLSLVGYLYYFMKFYFKVKCCKLNKVNCFFYSVYLMTFVELFVRGIGYFSPTIFLLIVAIFYFLNFNKSKLEFT